MENEFLAPDPLQQPHLKDLYRSIKSNLYSTSMRSPLNASADLGNSPASNFKTNLQKSKATFCSTNSSVIRDIASGLISGITKQGVHTKRYHENNRGGNSDEFGDSFVESRKLLHLDSHLTQSNSGGLQFKPTQSTTNDLPKDQQQERKLPDKKKFFFGDMSPFDSNQLLTQQNSQSFLVKSPPAGIANTLGSPQVIKETPERGVGTSSNVFLPTDSGESKNINLDDFVNSKTFDLVDKKNYLEATAKEKNIKSNKESKVNILRGSSQIHEAAIKQEDRSRVKLPMLATIDHEGKASPKLTEKSSRDITFERISLNRFHNSNLNHSVDISRLAKIQQQSMGSKQSSKFAPGIGSGGPRSKGSIIFSDSSHKHRVEKYRQYMSSSMTPSTGLVPQIHQAIHTSSQSPLANRLDMVTSVEKSKSIRDSQVKIVPSKLPRLNKETSARDSLINLQEQNNKESSANFFREETNMSKKSILRESISVDTAEPTRFMTIGVDSQSPLPLALDPEKIYAKQFSSIKGAIQEKIPEFGGDFVYQTMKKKLTTKKEKLKKQAILPGLTKMLQTGSNFKPKPPKERPFSHIKSIVGSIRDEAELERLMLIPYDSKKKRDRKAKIQQPEPTKPERSEDTEATEQVAPTLQQQPTMKKEKPNQIPGEPTLQQQPKKEEKPNQIQGKPTLQQEPTKKKEKPDQIQGAPTLQQQPMKKKEKPNQIHSPPPATKKKTIWALKERVEFEIAHNIIRPENQNEGGAEGGPGAYSQEIGEQEANDRFWELYSDFFSEKYIQGRYGKKGVPESVAKIFDPRAIHETKKQDVKEHMAVIKRYQKNLVEKVMEENLITKDLIGGMRKRNKEDQDSKVLELQLQQLEKQNKKKEFEKMTSLLGISKRQYLSMIEFEHFYMSRKNEGLAQIEKNQDVVLAKELFACWDKSRLGHIPINVLAENLISFGLAMSREQVLRLVSQLNPSLKPLNEEEKERPKSEEGENLLQSDQIEMKDFIKIFHKNKFIDKAGELIKQQCLAKTKASSPSAQGLSQSASKKSLIGGILTNSQQDDIISQAFSSKTKSSKRSKNYSIGVTPLAVPSSSKYANSRNEGSRYGESRYGDSRQGGSRLSGGASSGQGQMNMQDVKFSPSINDQIKVIKGWWNSMNTNQDPLLPISIIKKFFKTMGLSQDEEGAEKEIQKIIGKIKELDYDDFYNIFCKGIFRMALIDMIQNIERMSANYAELPLPLKLGAYRRNIMLSGIDSEPNDLKEKGKSILLALKMYKDEIDPEAFKKVNFSQFMADPLGQGIGISLEKRNKQKMDKADKHWAYTKIMERGAQFGIDVKEIDHQLKNQETEFEKELEEKLKKEEDRTNAKKKKKFLKMSTSPFRKKASLKHKRLQVINEQEIDSERDYPPYSRKQSSTSFLSDNSKDFTLSIKKSRGLPKKKLKGLFPPRMLLREQSNISLFGRADDVLRVPAGNQSAAPKRPGRRKSKNPLSKKHSQKHTLSPSHSQKLLDHTNSIREDHSDSPSPNRVPEMNIFQTTDDPRRVQIPLTISSVEMPQVGNTSNQNQTMILDSKNQSSEESSKKEQFRIQRLGSPNLINTNQNVEILSDSEKRMTISSKSASPQGMQIELEQSHIRIRSGSNSTKKAIPMRSAKSFKQPKIEKQNSFKGKEKSKRLDILIHESLDEEENQWRELPKYQKII